MTAGLFAKHGVWFGRCRPPSRLNQKGYWENNRIKEVMKRRYPKCPVDGPAAYQAGLRKELIEALRADGYKGGRWAFKCTALYGPALLCAFPNADVVVVFRDPDSIFRSTRATKMFGNELSDDELRENIKAHQDYMTYLMDHGVAFPVYTDDLIHGNYWSAIDALEGCGIKASADIIADHVEPKLWNYGDRSL